MTAGMRWKIYIGKEISSLRLLLTLRKLIKHILQGIQIWPEIQSDVAPNGSVISPSPTWNFWIIDICISFMFVFSTTGQSYTWNQRSSRLGLWSIVIAWISAEAKKMCWDIDPPGSWDPQIEMQIPGCAFVRTHSEHGSFDHFPAIAAQSCHKA